MEKGLAGRWRPAGTGPPTRRGSGQGLIPTPGGITHRMGF